MEYSLTHQKSIYCFGAKGVLILVLMEYSLTFNKDKFANELLS